MTTVRDGALAGVRVIDLTRHAPGPFCAMMLGDHGADVLQVCDPGQFGGHEPVGDGYSDIRGTTGDQLARNKRSVGLNLKSHAGQAVLHRLAQGADVVVSEWRPGVAERLRADYATLSLLNPRLVYCAISGYGQNGPEARAAGHDLNYVGRAGVLSLMTDQNGSPIVPVNIIADFGGGALAAFAILSALIARERTGRGQFIDASLTGATSYLATDFAAVAVAGIGRPQGGNWLTTGGVPFYGVYATKDGKHVTVAALETKFFHRLVEVLGCLEFAGAQWDRARYPAMRAAFQAAFIGATQAEWLAATLSDDVCIGPVEDFRVAASRRATERQDSTDGALMDAPMLSETPARVRSAPAPRFAHTRDVLAEIGYGADEIVQLCRDGTVR